MGFHMQHHRTKGWHDADLARLLIEARRRGDDAVARRVAKCLASRRLSLTFASDLSRRDEPREDGAR